MVREQVLKNNEMMKVMGAKAVTCSRILEHFMQPVGCISRGRYRTKTLHFLPKTPADRCVQFCVQEIAKDTEI